MLAVHEHLRRWPDETGPPSEQEMRESTALVFRLVTTLRALEAFAELLGGRPVMN